MSYGNQFAHLSDNIGTNPISSAPSSIAKMAGDRQVAPSALELDPRFQQALAKMQDGAWPEVLSLLYDLQADFLQVALLSSLINEAELKANLVAAWDEKIQGRRLTLRQQYWLRKSLPYMLVFILFTCGWVFYQTLIAPSRQVVAMTRASEQMLEEAQTLIRAGHYAEAIDVYNQILSAQRDNAAAQTGRADAVKLADYDADYRTAQKAAAGGDMEYALSLLRSIQAGSPNFRDVEAMIAEYESRLIAQPLFVRAEEAYRNGHWLDALGLYQQVQETDSDYQQEMIDTRLPEVYLRAGLQLLMQRPQSTAAMVQAQEYLRNGAVFDPNVTSSATAQLDAYEEGVQARETGALDVAISRWRTLYDQEPHFLGGLLAEQLYYIYLVHGTDAATRGDYPAAASLFEQATQLDVPDISEAENRLAIVSRA